ncbi:MAG TPA: ATP-binding protein [Mycobacteriales bacterium]|jgi:anti-sigma regulatory factor (Ser/Thr protein kinase)
MSGRPAERAEPDATTEEASTAIDVEGSLPTGIRHPEPDGVLAERLFTLQDLHAVRALVTGHAARFGLPEERASSFVLAVHEVAANSVQHGGGHGILRLWQDGDLLICEVRDRGVIDPVRFEAAPPPPDQTAGRGLWLARQLCDLVELRAGPTGSVVRLQISSG